MTEEYNDSSHTRVANWQQNLCIPVLGRMYATIRFPNILYDAKVLELRDILPQNFEAARSQTQQSFLLSAARSANMDRYIKDFLIRKPEGIIVLLGCGLETTYYRINNYGVSNTVNTAPCPNILNEQSKENNITSRTIFYEVDLPEVIQYRSEYFPVEKNERVYKGSIFKPDWIKEIRREFPEEPLLLTANNVFSYHKEGIVNHMLHELQNFGDLEIVFDAYNSFGMKQLIPRELRKGGSKKGALYFYVDAAKYLVEALGGNIKILNEEPLYAHVDKTCLETMTKITMKTSDLIGTIKMIHLSL